MLNAREAPILVVAALSRELGGLSRDPQPGLALFETGEGIANVERRLEAWLALRSARAVLSIGFAGALSPALRVGDLVVAREVRDSEGEPDARLLSAAGRVQMDGATLHFGVALTSHEILWKAEAKRTLASTLAAHEMGSVDMESTAIARVCARRGLPFLIARSITDLLNEDLPLDFNQCRDWDGRINLRRVVKATLFKPSALAGLLELRKRSQLCAERMAEFVRRLAPFISHLG